MSEAEKAPSTALETPETVTVEEAAPLGALAPSATGPQTEAPADIPPPPPFSVDGRGKNQEGKKRGPYKKKDDSENPSEPGQPLPIEIRSKPEKKFDKKIARESGERLGKMLIATVGQFKPGSLPQTPDELALAKGAIEQTGEYFVEKEMPDLPPGLALVMAWGAYYTVVAVAERNRQATLSFWGSVKAKFAGWNAMRKARKAAQLADKGKEA